LEIKTLDDEIEGIAAGRFYGPKSANIAALGNRMAPYLQLWTAEVSMTFFNLHICSKT